MNKKSKLQMIPVDKLHPHPDNPRKVLGDVSELAESIKANGILQNLTVVPNNDNWDDFTVIIGHRRLAAAKQAGLTELPCAVVEMTEKEQLSTMLTENMQRSDLTVYEEAKGCQLLLDLGDTVAEVAEKTGFSESKIRRRVKLCELDEEAFKESQLRQPTLQDYERLNKIENIEERNTLLKSIGTNNFNNAIYAAEAKQERKHTRDEIKKVCSDKGLLECETSGAPKGYKYEGYYNLSTLKEKSFDDGKKYMYYMSTYSNDIYVYVEITKDDKIKADEESAKRESERQTLEELRAQALAARLCDKGMSRVALYDVSSTHVSQLISEAFKYSHIVLASVTYNLGIYPAMHDFLMDMKALNLQNRTFALIENGSWAVKSGDLMQKFVNDELKNMTVLNERLSLASSLGEDKAVELETLADAILASVQ